MSYTARVSGIIWQGSKAWTEYRFPFHPTREQVMEKAGDFQIVQSIQLTETITTVRRIALREAA
jgi:hypothetical protein